MTTTRVKICGLTNVPDLDRAIAAGADAVGVIADVPVETPRELSPRRARELVAGVPPFVTSVLVTMPETPAAALDLHRQVGADAIQIHGTLSPAEVSELDDRTDAGIIAALDVTSREIDAFADAADAILVDTTDEAGGGGTGQTHDWERTREIRESIDVPLIVAGGLTPANVGAAIDAVGPFGVDTASGVETTGGEKDHEAVDAFVAQARNPEVAG